MLRCVDVAPISREPLRTFDRIEARNNFEVDQVPIIQSLMPHGKQEFRAPA